MSGETEQQVSGWTVDTLRIHHEALRAGDEKFQKERDRRYAEVATEREKALKIKETADLAALGLAREIQTYKDEKANELREQIGSERGNYATKDDLAAAVSKLDVTIKPLADYVTLQQGRSDSRTEARATVGTTTAIFGAVASIVFVLVVLVGLYSAYHRSPTITTPTVTLTSTTP